uniref:COMM domain containing 9 n=1 Tax=Callorhinchus milii TaxID=7868 RepID=A0A4W3ICI2_CALMI
IPQHSDSETRDYYCYILLFQAPSKDVVRQLCQESFSLSALRSDLLVDSAASSLSVSREQAGQVIQSLHKLTRAVVCQGPASPQDLLPQNFHQNLRNLLSKIILENIFLFNRGSTVVRNCQALWEATLLERLSLPHLVAMDWRVDIKASSDTVSRMAVPTCLLQMKIQDDAGPHRDGPAISTVSVELSKETLDTMLDGLGRIRDQLSAVASK